MSKYEPNLLDCNSLNSKLTYLKGQFEKCSTLKAIDLDLLVDVIYSLDQCNECNGCDDEIINQIYINTGLAPETIGGYLAGEPITPPEGLTYEETFNKLFSNITLPTLSFNINSETVEKGSNYTETVIYTFAQNDAGAELSYSLEKDGTEIAATNNFEVVVNPVTASFTLQGILNYDSADGISAGVLSTPLRTIIPRFRVWYDDVATLPTNSAEVRALGNNVWDNTNTITLNTGTTNNKFVVAIPTSINNSASLSAQDITNNISYDYDFTGTTINVILPDATTEEYRIYTLEVDNPYPSNAEHVITI